MEQAGRLARFHDEPVASDRFESYPTTHTGTSTTHTSSNVPPVKKNKIVEGHSGKIATGSKQLVAIHSPQHTDLQNESTILRYKYPSISTKSIDQHLATVKANTWVLNSKKSADNSKVSANTVNRVNLSSSTKGLSKTTTATKSGSKVASTKPTVNPHTTTALAKTGTATTAPIKGSLSSTLHRVYRDSLIGDIESGAQSTFAPVENTVTSVGGALAKGAGTVSSYVTGGITKVGNTLSPSSSPTPFVRVTGPQALKPFSMGNLLPPSIHPYNPIPSFPVSLLPPRINIPNPLPSVFGSLNNIPNIGNVGGTFNGFPGALGQFPSGLGSWSNVPNIGNVGGTLGGFPGGRLGQFPSGLGSWSNVPNIGNVGGTLGGFPGTLGQFPSGLGSWSNVPNIGNVGGTLGGFPGTLGQFPSGLGSWSNVPNIGNVGGTLGGFPGTLGQYIGQISPGAGITSLPIPNLGSVFGGYGPICTFPENP